MGLGIWFYKSCSEIFARKASLPSPAVSDEESDEGLDDQENLYSAPLI